MKIRNARKEDAEFIAKNNVKLAKETEGKEIDYKTTLKAVISVIINKQKGFYIVAESKNIIIGQLMITYEWSDWSNNTIWWIQSLYVNKFWRKKGIFNELLKKIKDKARVNKIEVIRLYVHKENNIANKVYQQIKMIEEPYNVYKFYITP